MNFVSGEIMSYVVGAIAAASVLLLMKGMAGAPAPVSPGGIHTLTYGWIFRAVGYLSIAAAALSAVLASFVNAPQPDERWIVLVLVAAFAGGGVALVIEARRRVLLGREGIEVLGGWGRRARLPWAEVTSVDYSSMAHQFTVRGRSGQKMRGSTVLVGMPTFVQHLRRHLPPAVFADAVNRYAQEERAT